jgi:hypothetical protein
MPMELTHPGKARRLLIFCSAALLLAGCGSSGGDAGKRPAAGPRTHVLSHAALVNRLDRLCLAGVVRTKAVSRELERAIGRRDYDATIHAIEHGLRVNEEYISELERLRPSGRDRDAFDRYKQAIVTGRRVAEKRLDALRARTAPPASLRAASAATKHQKLKALADLGADKCGQA